MYNVLETWVKEWGGPWIVFKLVIHIPVSCGICNGRGRTWIDPKPELRPANIGDDMYNRVGSQSADTVDKLSTVMSDMARFLLCHRYGGVYLDADNLLLRDWEELWGWKGAFAYRWSRLPDYNTAILRMHKHSALGAFLFRTALKNDFDFHPMTITKYLNDAHLQDLLFRLPDALFDPAWLSIEIPYQRERPPQPVFDK